MNTSIIKSDIFFFISTIAVVIVSICIIIISFYIIRILKDLKILSKNAKDEGDKILDNIKIIRKYVNDKGILINTFFSFLSSFLEKSNKHKPKK